MELNRQKLTAMGFDCSDFSDERLRDLNPEQMAELARKSAPKGQAQPGPLLGSEPVPTPDEGTTTGGGYGTPGTWETAMMSVAKVVPSIIQAAQYRTPRAPAANIGGRRVMDIPSTASTFGKKDPGFQSLLAMFLRGGR